MIFVIVVFFFSLCLTIILLLMWWFCYSLMWMWVSVRWSPRALCSRTKHGMVIEMQATCSRDGAVQCRKYFIGLRMVRERCERRHTLQNTPVCPVARCCDARLKHPQAGSTTCLHPLTQNTPLEINSSQFSSVKRLHWNSSQCLHRKKNLPQKRWSKQRNKTLSHLLENTQAWSWFFCSLS